MALLINLTMIDCTDGSIKIVPHNSHSRLVGRLEVCINGAWGVVCGDFFDNIDATVACRQLGYSPNGIVFLLLKHRLVEFFLFIGSIAMTNSYYSGAVTVDIIDLNCTGSEDTIWDCPSNALLGQYACSSTYYAGIACHSKNSTSLFS